MKYVEVDPASGVVSWDRYFEYLRMAEEQFPIGLRGYVADWENYSLEGENTLHDAWLIGTRFLYDKKELTLEFLGPRHDRRHALRYEEVQMYVLDLEVGYRHGDRDVLAHEFRVENACVTHEIQFANKGRIVIAAINIFPEVGLPL